MTKKEIREKSELIVMQQLGITKDTFSPALEFIEGFGADSLDLVELVMAFEEEFRVEIPDEEAEHIGTTNQAIKAVCDKIGFTEEETEKEPNKNVKKPKRWPNGATSSSGSGRTISKYPGVEVSIWNYNKMGRTTVLTFGNSWDGIVIKFQGDCLDYFDKERRCYSVLTPNEIMTLIKKSHEKGVSEDKNLLRKQLKGLMRDEH